MYAKTDPACSHEQATQPVLRDAALTADTRMEDALQHHFGFSSFRPLQRAIIEDSLAGRDVLALMPTGGGKSLCYQLPALLRPGLTLVVSPLIALMKDQVDFLKRRQLPAAMLNSHLPPDQSQRVIEALDRGALRLLYIAPERLMQPAVQARLRSWRIRGVAVDEAHCISEWGHDFRPEYRQIGMLRQQLPDVPMLGLTATATARVRTDIAEQLGLREPGVYVASFNRPNLVYRVEPKKRPYDRVLAFLRQHRGESGIVYCHTRRATELLAERLRSERIVAAPYHAGLDYRTRARTQDQFLADKVRVICATIAFGMGVDKPNIRFVVHYDAPKNIEGYYQETGRAGRDGEPAECLMLFGKNDIAGHERRADEKPDAASRRVALEQLAAVVNYAESRACRRRELLSYFGESYPASNCAGCDNCGTRPSATKGADATTPADDGLFQRLRAVRLRLARERNVPAYVIAHDSTLREIARARRSDLQELGKIRGMGERRARDLGDPLVAEVRRT